MGVRATSYLPLGPAPCAVARRPRLLPALCPPAECPRHAALASGAPSSDPFPWAAWMTPAFHRKGLELLGMRSHPTPSNLEPEKCRASVSWCCPQSFHPPKSQNHGLDQKGILFYSLETPGVGPFCFC